MELSLFTSGSTEDVLVVEMVNKQLRAMREQFGPQAIPRTDPWAAQRSDPLHAVVDSARHNRSSLSPTFDCAIANAGKVLPVNKIQTGVTLSVEVIKAQETAPVAVVDKITASPVDVQWCLNVIDADMVETPSASKPDAVERVETPSLPLTSGNQHQEALDRARCLLSKAKRLRTGLLALDHSTIAKKPIRRPLFGAAAC